MSETVKRYYDDSAEREWSRLDHPYSRVEWLSTLRLMDRYLPETGHICDIGSGPGRYAAELLQQGYRVTLMDLSVKALALAEQEFRKLGLQAEAYLCEDARNLHLLEADQFEGALVLGPLYHILEEEQRLQVIRQTARILKADGVALFSYINSWGVLKAGVTEFSESYRDPEQIYGYLQEQKLDENRGLPKATSPSPLKRSMRFGPAGLTFFLTPERKAFWPECRPR